MKYLVYSFLLCLFLVPSNAFNNRLERQTEYGLSIHQSWGQGEFLKYNVHYGVVSAGYAELEVKAQIKRAGRSAYKVVGKGYSTKFFDWFFKVRDTYESYIDAESLLPVEFIRDVDEGGYEIKRHLLFDHQDERVLEVSNNKEFQIPNNVQDMLSAFYYARALDLSGITVGDEIPIEVFLDYEVYSFKLKYLGVEVLDTDFGNIECLKMRPLIQEGRVFKDEEGMTLWVSNDGNKIPVRMQTDLVVGSVKMDLVDYKGLQESLKIVSK